ncbi:MAG: insulinase family protein [Myxococcaceae bacterium]|nr:insulinase family protein [Myxococcaceae bacterium]
MKTTKTPARADAPLKLRPLHLPPHEKRKLGNGLMLHLVPRGALPLVAVRLVMRGGSVWDPAGRAGVADFAARLFRRGAGGRTADELSEAIDFVGAALGGYANEENVVVSLSCPSKHLEAMFELMGQVLLSPDFPDNEIELARRRTLAQLQNELDDPGALAERAWARAMWGTHPYGHETLGQKRSIASLTRDDLIDFHRTRLGPMLGHLYVVGDIDVDRVTTVAERIFGGWKGGPEFAPLVPDWAGPDRAGQVIIVDKPEQTQVQVRIGAEGVKRGHPDHFPLTVMNAVLGGGFTSRLIREIRVKRGLSYGASSSWDMMGAAGTFLLASFTKTESINELIDVALGEVRKMRTKGPTVVETETMKRYITGLYPARLETNEALAGAVADVQHYGLPEDWISGYRDRVRAVTARDAAVAAQKHLFDDKRVIVLVGNASSLAPKVERYGPVSVVKPAELE